MIRKIPLCIFLLCMVSLSVRPALADLDVMREVVIAPKIGPAGANIGQVNVSTAVSMNEADVDIRVGPVPATRQAPLHVETQATFAMENRSGQALELTVGFPVSNSSYSAFKLSHFSVTTDGKPRTVCRRVTSYPWKARHEYVSGPGRECGDLPDYEDLNRARHVNGREMIGPEAFHNLMVWKETFQPGQSRTIRVDYGVSVPLQTYALRVEQARGNYKGIWPQEANNTPIEFLARLDRGRDYYLFDYYLTTGASWNGPIGRETLSLCLDESWKGHTLQRAYGPKLTETREQAAEVTYVYTLQNAEPATNMYFALER